MNHVKFFIGFALASLLQIACAAPPDYAFDGTISRPVLENYLARSISYTELLHDDISQPRDARGADPRDNLRFILNTKAKFIGRSLMLWGHESNLPGFLKNAPPLPPILQQAAPDIFLRPAEFEIAPTNIESIPIPAN